MLVATGSPFGVPAGRTPWIWIVTSCDGPVPHPSDAAIPLSAPVVPAVNTWASWIPLPPPTVSPVLFLETPLCWSSAEPAGGETLSIDQTHRAGVASGVDAAIARTWNVWTVSASPL